MGVVPMRLATFGVVLSLGLGLVGCSPDPSKPEYWEKRITEGKSKKEKVRAVEDLRASKFLTPAVYPVLYKRLDAEKSPEVKAAMVRLLGEQKDKGALESMANAVEMGATDTDVRTMNKEIAIALGHIADPKGAATLVKLLGTKDNFTVVAAIEALGEMKAREGFDALNKLAGDEGIEPFITKKAVIALGEIGDPRAVPTIARLMFKERRGVSFYVEASFALFQFGTPAADLLVPVIEGKDKEMSAWAESNHILAEALIAKSAQVIGDLHDVRAEKALITLLSFKSDKMDIMLFVRMKAADALARMRSKDGAKAISGMLTELEGNSREQYVWAVTRIGGRDTLPKLIDGATKGSWDARSEAIKGIAVLGDERELAALDKLDKDEPKTFDAECKSDEIGGHKDCADVPAGVKKHQEYIVKAKATLEAGKECKTDPACWAKKLNDGAVFTRERAAYEVGRSGKPEYVAALFKQIKEPDLDVRLAVIQGIDWLVTDSKDAQKAAQEFLPALEKQISEERGKTEFMKVNEDLRRLPVKIRRG